MEPITDLDLSQAVAGGRGAGSSRVLRNEANGQSASLTEWANAIADKFSKNPKSVAIALNNAVRSGNMAYGLKFALVAGKPYAESKPRGPRKATVVKKKAA